MTWQLLVFLRILSGQILFPILFKGASDLKYKTKQQFWIYSFCTALASLYFFSAKVRGLPGMMLIIIALGLLQSLAFYYSMRATNISQSKSSIFSVGGDFIAIILAYIFLKEIKYLNLNLLIGLLLCFISAAVFIYASRDDLKKAKKFFGYILIYSTIWGVLAIFERKYALSGVPFAIFGLGWYAGNWLGSILLYEFTAAAEEKKYQIPLKEILIAFGVSFFIWISLFLSYLALKIAPITVVQPFFLISGMIFPALIGLYVYKEIKSITKHEFLAFVIGIIGGVIIAFSF